MKKIFFALAIVMWAIAINAQTAIKAAPNLPPKKEGNAKEMQIESFSWGATNTTAASGPQTILIPGGKGKIMMTISANVINRVQLVTPHTTTYDLKAAKKFHMEGVTVCKDLLPDGTFTNADKTIVVYICKPGGIGSNSQYNFVVCTPK